MSPTAQLKLILILIKHFLQFAFEFDFKFCRFEKPDIAFLRQNERKQYLFGDCRDLHCAVIVDDLMGVQRS